VWSKSYIVEPHSFVGSQTGHAYKNFLHKTLPMLLQGIPLEVQTHMQHQHVGDVPHFTTILKPLQADAFTNRQNRWCVVLYFGLPDLQTLTSATFIQE